MKAHSEFHISFPSNAVWSTKWPGKLKKSVSHSTAKIRLCDHDHSHGRRRPFSYFCNSGFYDCNIREGLSLTRISLYCLTASHIPQREVEADLRNIFGAGCRNRRVKERVDYESMKHTVDGLTAMCPALPVGGWLRRASDQGDRGDFCVQMISKHIRWSSNSLEAEVCAGGCASFWRCAVLRRCGRASFRHVWRRRTRCRWSGCNLQIWRSICDLGTCCRSKRLFRPDPTKADQESQPAAEPHADEREGVPATGSSLSSQRCWRPVRLGS